MDYCVSLGLVTRRQLADWGNSKKEVAEFFLAKAFKLLLNWYGKR